MRRNDPTMAWIHGAVQTPRAGPQATRPLGRMFICLSGLLLFASFDSQSGRPLQRVVTSGV